MFNNEYAINGIYCLLLVYFCTYYYLGYCYTTLDALLLEINALLLLFVTDDLWYEYWLVFLLSINELVYTDFYYCFYYLCYYFGWIYEDVLMMEDFCDLL